MPSEGVPLRFQQRIHWTHPPTQTRQALQYFLEVADAEQICEQLMKLETLGGPGGPVDDLCGMIGS